MIKNAITAITILLIWIGNVQGQTSGPTSPEVQSFTPTGTDNMVNLFTGDFQYSIPLMDVGGYPINISYGSGVGMNDEASMVGLGWNFNPGVINRTVKGLPDDFNGDEIIKTSKIEPNKTIKLSYINSVEFVNFNLPLSLGLTVSSNNYRGIDVDTKLDASTTLSDNISIGLSLQGGSQGASMAPNLNVVSKNKEGMIKNTTSISTKISTIEGFQGVTITSAIHKKDKSNRKLGGSSFSLAALREAQSPVISNGSKTKAFDFGLQFGIPFFTPLIHGGGEVIGSYTIQTQKNNGVGLIKKAYGYLYLHNSDDNSVLDKSNEKQRGIYSNDHKLFLTYLEPDDFSVASEGFSGNFRPFRTDVSSANDPKQNNTSTYLGLTKFELNLGGIGAPPGFSLQLGGNLRPSWDENFSKKWGFMENSTFRFMREASIYFKNVGEMNVMNSETAFNNTGGFGPTRLHMNNLFNTQERLIDKYSNTYDISNSGSLSKEAENTNTQFTYLTADEAICGGLFHQILDYKFNAADFSGTGYTNMDPNGYEYKAIDRMRGKEKHHISEIIVTADNGTRYVFSVPAYNTEKYEYSFDINSNSAESSNLVGYSNEEKSTRNNASTNTKMYTCNKTPGYAYAYYLSAILSQDYVDLKGDGPTSDDYGTYTRFNYSRVYENYKWRTPSEKQKANFNDGYLSNDRDQSASFVCGKKEIWYIHSIESRNMIAEFSYEARNDAMEPLFDFETSPSITRKLYRLKDIKLYSKADLVRYRQEPNSITAIPPTAIKKVNFDFNYELCKGIYIPSTGLNNSNQGKLTLKGLKFEYANSKKESASGYEFEYSNINPNYAIEKTDRWGTYKSSPCLGLAETRAPYTPQYSRTQSNKDASAWLLSGIKTPNGGVIQIKYEADDYAYVQDKLAMQMYSVLGFAKSNNSVPIRGDFNNELFTGDEHKDLILVDLGIREPNENFTADDAYEYIKGLDQIYVNAKIKAIGNDENIFEYVQSFIEKNPISKQSDNNNNYGVIEDSNRKLAYFNINSNRGHLQGINSIAYDAWQKIAHERKELIYPPIVESQNYPSSISASFVWDIVVGFAESLPKLIDLFRGFKNVMQDKEVGRIVDVAPTFIRLNNTNGFKVGGGTRVKEIKISDAWDNMTNQEMQSKIYGNEYIYTTTSENGKEISSGVASYEPMLGGDENPFVVKDFDESTGKMSLGAPRTVEIAPFGESRMPSPLIGYSKVTVKPLMPSDLLQDRIIRQHKSGYTVSEYYTSKDFPTIIENTSLQPFSPEFKISPFITPYFIPVSVSYRKYATTQGFYIELNDMHGKLKKTSVYSENTNSGGINVPISYSAYFYKSNSERQHQLDNKANTINFENLNILSQDKLIGVDYDYYVELVHGNTVGVSPSFGFNLNLNFTPPFFVSGSGSVRPEFQASFSDLRIALTNKVVYRSGILDRVETYDNGSLTTAKNIAFDAKTGAVLVTSTNNEFKEPYYTTTIPAHFVNKAMNFASINEGLMGELTVGGSGSDAVNQIMNFDVNKLNGGEELVVQKSPEELLSSTFPPYLFQHPFTKAWVYKKDDEAYLIDEGGGIKPSGKYRYKIIRSGFHNMQTTPVMNVITKTNPIENNNNRLNFENVIDASATQYSDVWQSYAGFRPKLPNVQCECSENTSDPMTEVAINSDFTIDSNTFIDNNTNTNDNNLCEKLAFDCTGNYAAEVVSPEVQVNGNELLVTLHDNPLRDVDTYKDDCSLSFVFSEPIPSNVLHVQLIEIKRPSGAQVPSEYGDIENGLTAGCDNVNKWYGKMRFTVSDPCDKGSVEIEKDFVLTSDCSNSINCMLNTSESENPICVIYNPENSETVNPFVMGLRGNWRPSSTYKFITQRLYASTTFGNSTTALKDKGTYQTFHSFFQHASLLPPRIYQATSNGFWQRADINLITDPYGRSLETLDALNRPSSQVYGYNHQLPLATAVNAHYYDIAFDGFEDYTYKIQSSDPSSDPFEECDNLPHSQFYQKLITNQPLVFVQDKPQEQEQELPHVCIAGFQSHTGRNALCLNGNSITLTKNVENVCNISEEPDDNNMISLDLGTQNQTGQYKLQQCDLIRTHTPNKEGKKFILSAWVKEDFDIDNLDATNASIKVQSEANDGSLSVLAELRPSGKLINNWRQVTGEFTIPSSIKNIAFVLNSGGEGKVAYFDDIRVFPYNSTMKTHVFDPINLRMMAELDEQNFATFYEYDDEGQLTRTKKETEKGIVTIQEVRNAKPKNN